MKNNEGSSDKKKEKKGIVGSVVACGTTVMTADPKKAEQMSKQREKKK